MTRLGLLLFIVCTVLMTPLAAQAALTAQIQARASQLMNQGHAAEAYALLRRHHTPNTASAQEWFIFGVAAYRARDLNAAEMRSARPLLSILLRNAQSLNWPVFFRRRGSTPRPSSFFSTCVHKIRPRRSQQISTASCR